jgi:hypothetical protein
MRRNQIVIILVGMLFLSMFSIAGTLNVNAIGEPISTWTMESGVRLEGGWPSNPCVIGLPSGTYRMYYTDVLLEHYPLGSVVKSAISTDGLTWTRESGTRVGYGDGGETDHAGSPEVVVLSDETYRMYYANTFYDEGIDDYRTRFLSAVSTDGLLWTKEPGIRLDYGGTYDSIRMEHIDIVKLPAGKYRMYYSGYDGTHYRILSAITADGLVWTKEAGVRVDVGGIYDSLHVLSSVTTRIADGRYVMFYCGHSALWEANILSAVSTDGITWTKEEGIRIQRGSYALVAPGALVKLSEDQYRIYITADRYPEWTDRMRVLSAIGRFVLMPPVGGHSISIEGGTRVTMVPLASYLSIVAVLTGWVITIHRRRRQRTRATS